MGNTSFTDIIKASEITRNDFAFQYSTGRGDFGKIWVVKFLSNHQLYTMKEMKKNCIVSKQGVDTILNEYKLLSILRHPFLVNIKFAFQDRENLYLVTDLMRGGDLRYHFNQKQKFTETETKFFVACIVAGIEYLHINSIIHRDIKPENLFFDSKGYIRISGFGIARILGHNISSTNSLGTPGYMAPEVVKKRDHGIEVDYFALGVIIHELIAGKRLYLGRNIKEIKENMMSSQAKLVKSTAPEGWSMESVDFVNKLLARNPENRLGHGGPQEVKSHIWLRDINWKSLLEKKLEAPFKPGKGMNFDPWKLISWEEDLENPTDFSEIQALFKKFYYDWRDLKNQPNETTLNSRGFN